MLVDKINSVYWGSNIRVRFKEPKKDLKELFKRLVFNILCGNNDDHARNHAAFWDGKDLTLTPAYDICPQVRTGNETTQAMKIINNNGYSQLKTCLIAAHNFLLSEKEAIEKYLIYFKILFEIIGTIFVMKHNLQK